MKRSLPCVAALLLTASPALGLEVAGHQVPEALTIDGAALKLNGAGLRLATMFNVKVYVGALYLTTPASDPAAVVGADEAKSIRMTFLRDVDRDKMMETFREGFEKNSADAKALLPDLEKIATALPAEMKEKMELSVTYLPGKGTTVAGPAGKVNVAGKPFADAMFRIWLGEKPADKGLKEAMLGR
jgi:hypothetical protein